MDVLLVGADFEENLGVGMIAAVARSRGHSPRVVPFNTAAEARRVAARIHEANPAVVGLSIQFQHRATEFLSLARSLRSLGYRGHITCGGQFPSLAWQEVLRRGDVDSVVFYDGEAAFGELLDAIATAGAGRPMLPSVAGIAYRADDGAIVRTANRPLPEDLDALPFAERYREPSKHSGVPFVPIMGSRGCWGKCTYCSITTHYRDAREHGGGKTFRLRSPKNVAEEMAKLQGSDGAPCIFCFHDDNLLLPRPADSLERLGAIRRRLDELGVGKAGIIGKCRPETVTAELASKLRELGVIRLYVGVENAAEGGAAHLGRGKQHLAIDAALAACRANGIFTCYNLLIFEPQATLDDVETNVDFMRRHAGHPVNFCRAEPYFGTPLMEELSSRGALGGSYLGFDYRITDDRTELCFRIAAAVFRERNFRPDGVANRYMGLGYNLKVLEHFYPDPNGERARLATRVDQLTRGITLDTADYLARVLDLARTADLSDREEIERRAARLGLEISASDAGWQKELDGAYAAFEAFSARARSLHLPRAVKRFARGVAVGTSLAMGVTLPAACGGKTEDPGPIVSDPVPPDGGNILPSDPLPSDSGWTEDAGKDAQPDVTVVDPPPPDAGLDTGADALLDPKRLRLIDQWRDTSPTRSVRSADLPFSEPPDVRLSATREGDTIVATLQGGPDAVGLRWEGDGKIDGDGRVVRWTPEDHAADTLRVAVRSKGGLAVVSVRAKAAKA